MNVASIPRTPAEIHAEIEQLEQEYARWVDAHQDDPDEAPPLTAERLARATLRYQGETIDRAKKQRVTLYLDRDIVAAFRHRAEHRGKGYQTLINEALNSYLKQETIPLTEDVLRRVLREELHLPA
jgi:uncharacterized protein (DUF4415 family)